MIDGNSQTGTAGQTGTAARTGANAQTSATGDQGAATTGQAAPGRVDGANIGLPDTPNSPEERRLVTEVTALQMGLTPAAVPSFAPYLTAATLRGAPAVVR